MSIHSKHREETLLHHLLHDGALDVEQMAANLGVSPSTIRRDLHGLEVKGLLRRTHGGAVPVEVQLYEPFRYNASFQHQESVRSNEKRRIGLAAADLVQQGQIVAISAGTTATHVARCLRNRVDITIVTNAVNIAMELSHCTGVSVICTGGHLSGSWFSLLGPSAVQTVEEFNYDWAFIGLDGIHATLGATSNHQEEAAVNRAMAAKAHRAVAVADYSKLEKVARAHVCPINALSLLITDTNAQAPTLNQYEACGLEIKVV